MRSDRGARQFVGAGEIAGRQLCGRCARCHQPVLRPVMGSPTVLDRRLGIDDRLPDVAGEEVGEHEPAHSPRDDPFVSARLGRGDTSLEVGGRLDRFECAEEPEADRELRFGDQYGIPRSFGDPARGTRCFGRAVEVAGSHRDLREQLPRTGLDLGAALECRFDEADPYEICQIAELVEVGTDVAGQRQPGPGSEDETSAPRVVVAGCLSERHECLAVTKGRRGVVVAEMSLRRGEMEFDPIARRLGGAIAEPAALVPRIRHLTGDVQRGECEFGIAGGLRPRSHRGRLIGGDPGVVEDLIGRCPWSSAPKVVCDLERSKVVWTFDTFRHALGDVQVQLSPRPDRAGAGEHRADERLLELQSAVRSFQKQSGDLQGIEALIHLRDAESSDMSKVLGIELVPHERGDEEKVAISLRQRLELREYHLGEPGGVDVHVTDRDDFAVVQFERARPLEMLDQHADPKWISVGGLEDFLEKAA